MSGSKYNIKGKDSNTLRIDNALSFKTSERSLEINSRNRSSHFKNRYQRKLGEIKENALKPITESANNL